ncbi:MAG: hypothetical protein H7A25_21495 [Leptospiraceae bacterium]|nr:hypothetical protein [Leptospiraceae bacterium]
MKKELLEDREEEPEGLSSAPLQFKSQFLFSADNKSLFQQGSKPNTLKTRVSCRSELGYFFSNYLTKEGSTSFPSQIP